MCSGNIYYNWCRYGGHAYNLVKKDRNTTRCSRMNARYQRCPIGITYPLRPENLYRATAQCPDCVSLADLQQRVQRDEETLSQYQTQEQQQHQRHVQVQYRNVYHAGAVTGVVYEEAEARLNESRSELGALEAVVRAHGDAASHLSLEAIEGARTRLEWVRRTNQQSLEARIVAAARVVADTAVRERVEMDREDAERWEGWRFGGWR